MTPQRRDMLLRLAKGAHAQGDELCELINCGCCYVAGTDLADLGNELTLPELIALLETADVEQ